MTTLTITKLFLPPNITTPITVSLYIEPYYGGSRTLIEANVPVNLDGTITISPPPHTDIDPTQKYLLTALNQNCGYVYQQAIVIAPYCPIGYALSSDSSYCFKQIFASATPPTNPQNSVAVTRSEYALWGSLIYNSGYNQNGTGSFTQINYANTFWVNGAGWPTGAGANTALGPLNRSGLWTSVPTANQTIGFSVCINAPTDGIYYVGTGSDNYTTIKLDSNTVVQMDPSAMASFLSANGYATVGVECTFRFWHIYPVMLVAGEHILEVIGTNVTSVASIGVEIYNNTSAQIQAATDYATTGLNLVFSSKDQVGLPVQLGSGGTGYSCPTGYALEFCNSPIVCVKTIITPVLF